MNNVLFACLFLCMLGNTTQEDVFGLSGGEIELYPGSSAASITRILWRYQDHKLAEWETNDAGPEYYGIYKARTSLDTKTGILNINNLTKSDNALYSVEINGQPTPKKYNLDVINALDKPAVTCQVNNDSTVTLLCAADQSPRIQYSWEGPDTQGQPGYELQIGGEESQNSDSVYTCVVKNPVSENRQGFPVKSCFPAQGNIKSKTIPLVVLLLLLLLIISGLLYIYCKTHKKETTSQKEKDTEAQADEQLIPTGHHEETPTLNEALTEPPRTADSKVGILQEESQAESFSQGGLIDGIREEGSSVQISPKHPTSGTFPFPILSASPLKTGKKGVSEENSRGNREEESVQGQGGDLNSPPAKPPRSPFNPSAGKQVSQNTQDGEEQASSATTSHGLSINKSPPIHEEKPSDSVLSQNTQEIEKQGKPLATTSHSLSINKCPPIDEDKSSDPVLSQNTREIQQQEKPSATASDDLPVNKGTPAEEENSSDDVLSQSAQEIKQLEKPPATTSHNLQINKPPPAHEEKPSDLVLSQNTRDGEEQAPPATTSCDLPINKSPPIHEEEPSDSDLSQNTQKIEQQEKTSATTSHDLPINKATPAHEEKPSDLVLSQNTRDREEQATPATTSCDLPINKSPPIHEEEPPDSDLSQSTQKIEQQEKPSATKSHDLSINKSPPIDEEEPSDSDLSQNTQKIEQRENHLPLRHMTCQTFSPSIHEEEPSDTV